MIFKGNYDKIVLYCVIRDFLNQLVINLSEKGILYIREPLSENQGIKLHELINLIENTKTLRCEYRINRNLLFGEFVDCKCFRNN